jgi:hypothetical protein
LDSNNHWLIHTSYGELGHLANEYNGKPESHMEKNKSIEEPIYGMADPIYDDSDSSEEILNGNDGTMLVVQKIMLSPKGYSGQNWLHSRIFQTTCIINDKLCNLMIDGGSC